MIDISSGIHAVLAARKRSFPQLVNRISAMDDPCTRRLVYRRTAWDKATPIPDSLQGVFETGNVLEPAIERIVSEVGHASTPQWRIVGAQTSTNDSFLKNYNISGSIDGFLQVFAYTSTDGPDGVAYSVQSGWETLAVVDIKTMSPNVFPQINSYGDLAKYTWTRGYRGQLMLYAFAHNLENCCLLLVNKSNLFDMKFIDFAVDMDYVQGLLDKAEAVNLAIEWDELPKGINDPDQCPRCQWFSFCAPDVTTGGNLEIVDNGELEAVLTRMEELSPGVKEYSDLEKARDLMLTKGRDIVVGPFMVKWTETSNHQFRKRITRMTKV